MKKYYFQLGVGPDATKDKIKAMYRRLAMVFHPDRANGRDEVFKMVAEAYEVLSDPRKRAEYDARREPCNYGPTQFLDDLARAATRDARSLSDWEIFTRLVGKTPEEYGLTCDKPPGVQVLEGHREPDTKKLSNLELIDRARKYIKEIIEIYRRRLDHNL